MKNEAKGKELPYGTRSLEARDVDKKGSYLPFESNKTKQTSQLVYLNPRVTGNDT